ncbi:TolC family protein [uncultured Bacteroides sp.]|uniref:TolC family protein n=1 Tax=uncultured Bacteroides sp. TaxID=162156 RepID=UPI0025CF48EE|nr:TolC family protein [uncultured Bacteroides sp.]
MKTIRKTISAVLLSGIGMISIQAQENSSSQAWTLRQCIDYAIEHNTGIRQSANNAEMNKVNVHTAKWARLPNLNGNASQNWSWGRTASPVDNSYSNINSANTSFSLGTNVPVFTGLQLSNQYSLAKLDLQAAMEDLNKAKEDIAVNVTSAYLQVLFNLELSKVAYNQVNLSKDQLRRIQGLFEVGKASPSEVAEAQARIAQDEMTAVQADNRYKLSLLDLSQLLELPTPEGFILETPQEELKFAPLTPPDDIYTQALAYKPGIKSAEYRLQGSVHNIRIAQSNYYPQLSFSAGLGSNYYTVNGKSAESLSNQMKNNLNKYVGFNLSVPLFNRFSTRNRVRTARLQQNNLTLQLDNAKKTLYKEIQQSWYNALAAESKYNSSEVAVKANEESFRLMNEKFNNGKATFVEYNEAKMNLTKALSDRLQAKYDYLFCTKILDFYKGEMIK